MASADSTTAQRYLDELDRALLAPNTHKGYQADWQIFARWCTETGAAALPATPETLSLFIASRLTEPRKVSTVARNVAAVGHIHREAGFDSPVTPRIRELLRAARRLKTDKLRQVRPLSVDQVRSIAQMLVAEDTPMALRNRALLLVGFASALRSASLAALAMDDIEFTVQGLIIHLRRSKTDQEGRGMLIGLPFGERAATCPVNALQAWIARRGDFPGPVFTRFDNGPKARPIQPERISQVVQELVSKIGLDPRDYGSHSMRAGFVTAAGEGGCSELSIAATTGHRDLATLRRYFRKSDLWRSNPSGKLGL